MAVTRIWHLVPSTPGQLQMAPTKLWSADPCCGVFETEEAFVNYLLKNESRYGNSWYRGTRDKDGTTKQLRDILIDEKGNVVENGRRVQEVWLASYSLGGGYVDEWNTLYQTEQEYIEYLRLRVATSPVSSVLYKGVKQGEKLVDTSRSVLVLCNPSSDKTLPTPMEYLVNYRVQADPKRNVVSAHEMPVGSLGWFQKEGRDADPVLKISVPLSDNTFMNHLVFLGSNKQMLLNGNLSNEHTARNTLVRLLDHREQIVLVGHNPG